MTKIKAKNRKSAPAVAVQRVVQHREELKGIKRVLMLVDGYLSTQDQYLALAWNGGVMTYGELRKHLAAALKTKVLTAEISDGSNKNMNTKTLKSKPADGSRSLDRLVREAEPEEGWKERLLRYRQEHFAVEIAPTRAAEHNGQISLSITCNGTQWQSVSLLPDEIPKVIAALQTCLPND